MDLRPGLLRLPLAGLAFGHDRRWPSPTFRDISWDVPAHRICDTQCDATRTYTHCPCDGQGERIQHGAAGRGVRDRFQSSGAAQGRQVHPLALDCPRGTPCVSCRPPAGAPKGARAQTSDHSCPWGERRAGAGPRTRTSGPTTDKTGAAACADRARRRRAVLCGYPIAGAGSSLAASA